MPRPAKDVPLSRTTVTALEPEVVASPDSSALVIAPVEVVTRMMPEAKAPGSFRLATENADRSMTSVPAAAPLKVEPEPMVKVEDVLVPVPTVAKVGDPEQAPPES